MSGYERIDRYLELHLDDSLRELARYVSQPSIGVQGLGLDEGAELVRGMLEKRGFTAEVLATGGAPVVLAERKGRSDRALLVYNHYDVQPPEPLEAWKSPPFEPVIRDGKMYGRGVSDDKSHLTARLLAIDALLEEDGELPCTVKFIVEGEEETGSGHLPGFVAGHSARLEAGACIWESGTVDHRDVPQLYLGMRGICCVELSVASLSTDVHSGLGGSIFPNAAWRLVWALGTLKGEDERIRIPGFYDDVVPPGELDRQLLSRLAEVADEYRSRYGVKRFLKGLESGTELKVEGVFSPSCTICGLTSGYQGPGVKTVLPARASAKLDFRLVPTQEPEDVVRKLRAHLDAQGFGDVEVRSPGGSPAARTDPDHPFVKLVAEAATDVYGVPMEIVPIVGWSGPIHAFVRGLGLPVVTMGHAYHGANTHAPNENIRIDLYLKHARHAARVLREYAK